MPMHPYAHTGFPTVTRHKAPSAGGTGSAANASWCMSSPSGIHRQGLRGPRWLFSSAAPDALPRAPLGPRPQKPSGQQAAGTRLLCQPATAACAWERKRRAEDLPVDPKHRMGALPHYYYPSTLKPALPSELCNQLMPVLHATSNHSRTRQTFGSVALGRPLTWQCSTGKQRWKVPLLSPATPAALLTTH